MFDYLINPNPTISLRRLVKELFADVDDFDRDSFLENLLFSLDGTFSWGDNTNYVDAMAFVAALEDNGDEDDNINRLREVVDELATDFRVHLIDLSN